jgi:NAD+ synthase (glutamine-hydrolysing)
VRQQERDGDRLRDVVRRHGRRVRGDQLDPVIEGYVEGDESVAELAARGFDPELARRVARMVDRNEYKRRQAPPGVRVSPKAFGKDRRPPITNRWPG